MHEKVVDLIDHFRPDILVIRECLGESDLLSLLLFHASPFLYNEYLEQERQFYYGMNILQLVDTQVR
jgi:hypothetical protein